MKEFQAPWKDDQIRRKEIQIPGKEVQISFGAISMACAELRIRFRSAPLATRRLAPSAAARRARLQGTQVGRARRARLQGASGLGGGAGRVRVGLIRRFAGFAGLETGGDSVDLREQSFPRGVVIQVFRRSRLLVAVESAENFEIRLDFAEVAGGDRRGLPRCRFAGLELAGYRGSGTNRTARAA